METYAIHMKSGPTLAVTLNRISAYQHQPKKIADSLNEKQHHKFRQIDIHCRVIVFDSRHIYFYVFLLIYIENKPDKVEAAL